MARRQRLDRDLRRYLVSGERVVTAVRQHWAALSLPVAAFVAATVFAFWVDITAPVASSGRALANAGWLLWLAVACWAGWRVLNWRRDWFVATDKRMLLFYGFIRRRVAMMPLTKVTDMTFERSIPGRMLGYGSFLLESAGQDQALSQIEFVPDADYHYREICAVLFGSEESAAVGNDGDDEGWDGWEDGDGWEDPDPYAGGPAPRGGLRERFGRGRGIPGHGDDAWPGGPVDDRRSASARRRGGNRDSEHGSGAHAWDTPTQDELWGRGAAAHPAGESIYRSPDRIKALREADTGEIPVVPAREQWYVPRDWLE
jgi:hypothetical protein